MYFIEIGFEVGRVVIFIFDGGGGGGGVGVVVFLL